MKNEAKGSSGYGRTESQVGLPDRGGRGPYVAYELQAKFKETECGIAPYAAEFFELANYTL